MTTGKTVLLSLLVGALGFGFGMLGKQWLAERQALGLPLPFSSESETDVLDRLPPFTLPDSSGKKIASDLWAGKVVVLNFWATWCPPCLRELPLFNELQRAHSDDGVQFVGIAVDDVEAVRRFLVEHPVAYPILLGDIGAIELSRQLGNRVQGLPFTVIFDRSGKRVFGRAGEMTRAALSKYIDPFVAEASQAQTTGNQPPTDAELDRNF